MILLWSLNRSSSGWPRPFSARERGQGREEAMHEYLAWEIDLVNRMASVDDQRFRVASA